MDTVSSTPPVPLDGQVIAVLRTTHANEYAPVIESLIAGGIHFIELTLTTQGVLGLLPVIRETFGDTQIGIGTVTTVSEAGHALDAGAQFLVTPTMNLPVIHLAATRGTTVIPGGLTPTELHAGWNAGATAVKVFPASTVGPDYITQLRGPFPDIQLVPSGGISIEEAPRWIAAGAQAVSLGGPLLRDAFKGGNLQELTERASRVTNSVAEAGTARKGKNA